jgi:hypothetical protein
MNKDECYENLRIAILRQAVTDYVRALTDEERKDEAADLERFFKSEWGEFLSGGHGDFIISECKRRVNMV